MALTSVLKERWRSCPFLYLLVCLYQRIRCLRGRSIQIQKSVLLVFVSTKECNGGTWSHFDQTHSAGALLCWVEKSSEYSPLTSSILVELAFLSAESHMLSPWTSKCALVQLSVLGLAPGLMVIPTTVPDIHSTSLAVESPLTHPSIVEWPTVPAIYSLCSSCFVCHRASVPAELLRISLVTSVRVAVSLILGLELYADPLWQGA